MARRRDPRLPGFDRATSRGVASQGTKTARVNQGGGLKWRCCECGEIQRFWSRAERHADEKGHHRIEVVFSEGEAA